LVSKKSSVKAKLNVLHSLPLVAIEKGDSKLRTLANMSFEQLAKRDVDDYFVTMRTYFGATSKFTKGLKQAISKTDEYKFIFEYCFPAEKLTSLAASYCIMETSTVKPEIHGAFAPTRKLLREVRDMLENSGDFTYVSPSQKFGSANSLKADQTGAPGSNKASILAMMAAKAPYLILKALMEEYDPNISKSKKITNLVEAVGSAAAELVRTQLESTEPPTDEEEINDITEEIKFWTTIPIQIPSAVLWWFGIWPSIPMGPIYLAANLIETLRERAERNRQSGTKNKELGQLGIDSNQYRKLKCDDEGELIK